MVTSSTRMTNAPVGGHCREAAAAFGTHAALSSCCFLAVSKDGRVVKTLVSDGLHVYGLTTAYVDQSGSDSDNY
jgi:hypothetical protein